MKWINILCPFHEPNVKWNPSFYIRTLPGQKMNEKREVINSIVGTNPSKTYAAVAVMSVLPIITDKHVFADD